MKQLLSIEWIKVKKLRAFTWIILLYMILLPLWMWVMNLWFGNINRQIEIMPDTKTLWSFPTVWRFVTYSGSYFNLFLSVIIVVLTTNEFTNRTMRQHVIDGLTKQQVIFSKFLVILGLSLFVTFYVFLVGLVFGLTQSANVDLYSNIHYVGLFFVQSLCYFSFAFLLSILIKRSALSLIIFYGAIILELIISFFIPQIVYAFFPFKNFAKLTPIPFLEQLIVGMEQDAGEKFIQFETWQVVSISLFFMLLFYSISYWKLKSRDM